MILDGGSPGSASTTSLGRLSGRSCGSTTTLTALSKDLLAGKVDNTVVSSNNENLNPNSIVELKGEGEGGEGGGGQARRGMKRRSLTETGEMARPLQVHFDHHSDCVDKFNDVGDFNDFNLGDVCD